MNGKNWKKRAEVLRGMYPEYFPHLFPQHSQHSIALAKWHDMALEKNQDAKRTLIYFYDAFSKRGTG